MSAAPRLRFSYHYSAKSACKHSQHGLILMAFLRASRCGEASSALRLRSIGVRPLVRSRLPNVRTSIAAPQDHQPLLSRRGDRELPKVSSPWLPWLKTFPIFVAIITVSALGMFNYQKTSSSVVASTLYALRTSDLGRAELGDEIYFRDKWPWIWGELNQLKGRIDIKFAVKGSKSSGMMRFRCRRRERMGFVRGSCIPSWGM